MNENDKKENSEISIHEIEDIIRSIDTSRIFVGINTLSLKITSSAMFAYGVYMVLNITLRLFGFSSWGFTAAIPLGVVYLCLSHETKYKFTFAVVYIILAITHVAIGFYTAVLSLDYYYFNIISIVLSSTLLSLYLMSFLPYNQELHSKQSFFKRILSRIKNTIALRIFIPSLLILLNFLFLIIKLEVGTIPLNFLIGLSFGAFVLHFGLLHPLYYLVGAIYLLLSPLFLFDRSEETYLILWLLIAFSQAVASFYIYCKLMRD